MRRPATDDLLPRSDGVHLRIPDDFKVIGLTNVAMRHAPPALTTIQQPITKLARAAPTCS